MLLRIGQAVALARSTKQGPHRSELTDIHAQIEGCSPPERLLKGASKASCCIGLLSGKTAPKDGDRLPITWGIGQRWVLLTGCVCTTLSVSQCSTQTVTKAEGSRYHHVQEALPLGLLVGASKGGHVMESLPAQHPTMHLRISEWLHCSWKMCWKLAAQPENGM